MSSTVKIMKIVFCSINDHPLHLANVESFNSNTAKCFICVLFRFDFYIFKPPISYNANTYKQNMILK